MTVLGYLPKVVLASLILTAVLGLVEIGEIKAIYKTKKL